MNLINEVLQRLTKKDIQEIQSGKEFKEVFRKRIEQQNSLIYEIIEQKTKRSKQFKQDVCEKVYSSCKGETLDHT